MSITVTVTPPSVVPAITAGAQVVVSASAAGVGKTTIGAALRLSVVNIDDPSTELAALGDSTWPAGTIAICTQDVAGANAYRVYILDLASSTAQSTPNRINRAAGGQWILEGGKGVAGSFTVETTLTVGGALGVTGTATFASTLAAGDAISSASTITGTQLVSTAAIGTAPLVVTSTTVVPNLNVSQLLGSTWAIPGTIGSTTPNTGTFTTLVATTLNVSGITASSISTTGAGTIGTGLSVGPSASAPTTGLITLSRSANAAILFQTGGTSVAQLRVTGTNALSITDPSASAFLTVDTTPTTGSVTVTSNAASLNVNATTASSSTTTGSLINAGGFGNAGAAYIGGALTVTGHAVFNSGNTDNYLTIGNSTNGDSTARFLNGSTHRAWLIGGQFNVSEAFEITPSTAVGGTTFSTPALVVFGATGNTVLGTTTDLGAGFTLQLSSASTGTTYAMLSMQRVDTQASNLRAGPFYGANGGRITANWNTGSGYLGLGAGTDDQIKINESGQLSVLATTDSTTTGTGSIITAGGAGIAKALTVGTTISAGGALSVSTSASALTPLTINGPSGGFDMRFVAAGGATTNWHLASSYNVGNALEITPSSAVGGGTYSTPSTVWRADGTIYMGSTADDGLLSNVQVSALRTLTGNVTNGMSGAISLKPRYTGAFTVSVAHYIAALNMSAGTSTISNGALVYFDANAGTHYAIDVGTTKTTPATVTAWIKVNINGTIYYLPAYTSKTS